MRGTPASDTAAALIVCGLAIVALASGRPQPTAAYLQRAPSKPAALVAARALRDGQPLDLNSAQPADLLLLPGVGPKLAQRIVDERLRRGGFREIGELRAVKGIGANTLERLRRFVKVERGSARATTDPTARTH